MLLYLIFLLLVGFLLYLDQIEVRLAKSLIFRTTLFLFLLFILVFRFDVGFDYVNYYKMIDEANLIQIFRLEPLSILFHLICIYVSNPVLIFILYGLPTCFLFFISISKYSKIFSISILYFLSFIYLDSFSFIRQILALAICFYGYKYVLTKSFWRYLGLCFFASMFHYSALFSILVYIIYWYFSISVTLFLSFSLVIFRNLLFIIFASTSYSYYFDKLNDFTGGGLVRFVMIALFMFFFVIDILRLKNNKIDPLACVVLPSLFLPFIFGPSLGMRLGAYFSVYLCLYIPNVIERSAYRNKIVLVLFCISFFCIFFILMIYIGSLNSFKELYTPYRFVFMIDDFNFK